MFDYQIVLVLFWCCFLVVMSDMLHLSEIGHADPVMQDTDPLER
jgi:hypothetical protein